MAENLYRYTQEEFGESNLCHLTELLSHLELPHKFVFFVF